MTTRRKFMAELAAGAFLTATLPHYAFGERQAGKLKNFGFISNLLNDSSVVGVIF